MKIRRFKAQGFGCLRGEWNFCDEKVNLIIGENETGKSTLIEGILTALYGFPEARRQKGRRIVAQDRFRPWDGGPYASELELESDGDIITIQRDFTSNWLAVLDYRSGKDIKDRFRDGSSYTIGESILGISRDTFENSAFVRQLDITQIAEKASIINELQRLVTSRGRQVSTEEAIVALRDALSRKWEYTRKTHSAEYEVKEIQKVLKSKKFELKNLIQSYERAREDHETVTRLQLREAQLEGERAKYRYLKMLLEQERLKEQLTANQQAKDAIEALAQERKSLEGFSQIDVTKLEELQQLSAGINSAMEDRGKLQRGLEKLESQRKTSKKLLRGYGAYRDIVEKDRLEVSKVKDSLQEKLRHLEQVIQTCREGKARFAGEGYDYAEISNLQLKFKALSVPEKDFISEFKEKSQKLGFEIQSLKNGLKALNHELNELEHQYRHRRKRALSMIATGAAIVGSGVAWFLRNNFLGLIGAIIGIVLAILGAIVRKDHSLEKRADLKEKIVEHNRIKESEENNLSILLKDMDVITQKAGFVNRAICFNNYRRYLRTKERYDTLKRYKEAIAEAEKTTIGVKEKARQLFLRVNQRNELGEITLESLETLEQEMERYLRLSMELTNEEAKLAEVKLAIEGKRQSIEEKRKKILAILEANGIDVGNGDIRLGIEEYKGALRKSERYDKIAEEIKSYRNSRLTNDQIENIQKRLEELSQSLNDTIRVHPYLRGLAPERLESEYSSEMDRVSREIKEIQDKTRTLESQISGIIEEYKNNFSKLKSEVANLEQRKQKIEQFEQAVELAIKRLQDISEHLYKSLAEELNAEANGLLENIEIGYGKLKFDEDLSMTIAKDDLECRLGELEVEHLLSVGAKDQIYLVMRLSFARCLSKSAGSLPIVLDDPFITSDDGRFERFLRMVVRTLKNRQQVIILSCHRARHEKIRHKDQVWFDENISYRMLEYNNIEK